MPTSKITEIKKKLGLWKDQKEDEKDSKKKKFRDRIKMFENVEKDDDKGRTEQY